MPESAAGLWSEVIKQVPALAVLSGLVWYFFQHLRNVSEAADKRSADLVAINNERLTELIHRSEASVDHLSRVVTTNSEVLGGIRTLLTLVENDLKNTRRDK